MLFIARVSSTYPFLSGNTGCPCQPPSSIESSGSTEILSTASLPQPARTVRAMQSMTAAIMNEYFLILFIKHSFLFLIICAAYFIKSRLKHHEHGQRAEGYGDLLIILIMAA